MAIREENGKLRVDIARKGMPRHTKTFPLEQREKLNNIKRIFFSNY
jgi:hypothetical protein